MSSIPCKFKDKCDKNDCLFSHDPPSRPAGINPTLCKYGENCRTKRCTFTHLKPPIGATATRPDCKKDVNCSRTDCFFNHPNGRFIDHNAISSLDNAQQNTASSSIVSPSPSSENGTLQRHDSSQSDTSTITNPRMRNCRLDTKCKRPDCYFEHPHGRDIDRVPTTTTNNTRTKVDNRQLSDTELIEMIDKLLSKAEEQQQEFDMNDKEDNGSDDEQILDALQENELGELRSQKYEFQLAINCLTTEYNSILSSAIGNKYDVLQLQRIQKQSERELKHWQSRLPIYARRSDIIEKLKRNQVLILKADTGSGKSTQTVQYLCDEHFADHKQIICTQPRKLAARSLATRVAEEYGCQVGEEVGFQVGGGRSTTSNRTKIKFVTDTLFLNEYQNDPMLQKYSIVIIDEAHERKIDTDIAFGIMKKCLRKRKDLKLVVMSATLDMHLLYKYFAHDFQCDKLEVGGRTYPIEDTYLDDDVENYVQTSVTKAIQIHQSGEIGDILVFLTGQDEIDLALADLNQKLEKDEIYLGLPLHGKLSEEENARIFEKIPNIRKIIFSTNVAETSVTIDGIKHVIESGMVKEKMWDEKRKMQVLKIGQITKSSVKQRRGRAGRTSAGKCYHLYTLETYEAMDACSRAEILCTQPTIAILKLKHLNIDNIELFEWLEPPSKSTLHEAHQTLIWLNALDSQDKLTDLGRNMARLDIDPKLTAMLYKGKELNCLSYALILAGMLTVSQNIWWNNKDQKSKDMATQTRAQFSHESGDHITFINIYLKWSQFCAKDKNKRQQYEWCKTNFLNGKSLQMAQDFIREKAKQMEHEVKLSDTEEELNDTLIIRLLQCVTAGYFLNLAVSNGPWRAGYQVISAFSPMTTEPVIARVFRTSTLCFNDQMPKYILFNELLSLNGTNYITILSSINLDWLKFVSQQWYTTVNGANLHSISYESYTFENIGATLLRAVVGKRSCNLNKIEEMTQTIIDVDYKQAKLTIWSRKTNLEKAKKSVEKMVREEKQKLLIEAEEIQITGRTRILMGAGSVSQMILVEDEFIRIIITELSTTVTEERIKNLCEPFGQIRKIDFIRQNEGGSCVAVTYSTIEQARKAFGALNGYIEQGRDIAVSGSCLKTEATTGKQNCRLKAIWYLTQSTGNGKITFSQEKSACDACQLFKRLNYECHYERSTSLPTLKVIYYLGENSGKAFINFESPQQAIDAVVRMKSPHTITLAQDKNNRAGSVLFQNFQKDFDEEDVRTHFQGCNGLVGVQVLRGRKGQKFLKPNSAEDDIKSIFNHYKSFQRDTITFNSNIINGKLEAYVEFLDIKDLKQAIQEMNGRTGIIGCGKVRLSERTQQKKDDTKKKKENEYIIKFQRLGPSCDKYDLIKILKENELYDDVQNVIIFRQKLENKQSTTTEEAATALEEQVTGLASLRSMFLNVKNLFHSIPDCQIPSSTPDGTVTALVLFNDPVDVTTAIQTYDNKEIQLFRHASKLRLIPSISHEIFVNAALTKAIPDKIQQAIQHIRERFKRVYIKAVSSKKTEKAATMKIFIDGDDIQQITMAKIKLDSLMKGMEYKFDEDLEKTRILFDRVGTTVLQRIQNETGSYIWWNYSNSFIRIYGSDQALVDTRKRIDQYIRDTLKNKKHTITLDIPPGCVRQVLKMSATYQETVENEFNVDISTLVAKRQIQIIGKEENVINCEQIIKNKWLAMPAGQQTSFKQTTMAAAAECPICCDVANYYLQACGHAYCLECLKQEVSTKFDTTLSNETLKIKCMMQKCDSAFLLRDIKTIIDPMNMPKLARASFQAYLKTDKDIAQCMGIDCNQVYRKSKHPQSYFCDGCLKIYCVKCEVEYHMGITCNEYQALLKWKQEEGSTLRNIGNLDLKPCPSCKQVIDRHEGCNAVKCKCGISFCWLCLKTDPVDIHFHYGDPSSNCYNKCFSAK